MKISITATEKVTTMDGVPVRVWEGVTERGAKCLVFVHRVAVPTDEPADEFNRELHEMLPPQRPAPLRHIL